ncbi:MULTISPECIES: hypothetical protein [unclassified Helicobacter]|uniref:hypothetical protein n=1 Tax=unclassified Helicobacter TaxID=2593540 RepID=UPI0011C0625B|nr:MULTISPECIES: hypothetical protein [unclassified Helicobacter]
MFALCACPCARVLPNLAIFLRVSKNFCTPKIRELYLKKLFMSIQPLFVSLQDMRILKVDSKNSSQRDRI